MPYIPDPQASEVRSPWSKSQHVELNGGQIVMTQHLQPHASRVAGCKSRIWMVTIVLELLLKLITTHEPLSNLCYKFPFPPCHGRQYLVHSNFDVSLLFACWLAVGFFPACNFSMVGLGLGQFKMWVAQPSCTSWEDSCE